MEYGNHHHFFFSANLPSAIRYKLIKRLPGRNLFSVLLPINGILSQGKMVIKMISNLSFFFK
jgi:hypothetical protein